jgi:hypothetical protein
LSKIVFGCLSLKKTDSQEMSLVRLRRKTEFISFFVADLIEEEISFDNLARKSNCLSKNNFVFAILDAWIEFMRPRPAVLRQEAVQPLLRHWQTSLPERLAGAKWMPFVT